MGHVVEAKRQFRRRLGGPTQPHLHRGHPHRVRHVCCGRGLRTGPHCMLGTCAIHWYACTRIEVGIRSHMTVL